MKKRNIAVIFGMVVVALLIYISWPTSKTVKAVDVVNGITPASSALSDIRVTLQELARMPTNQREARLRQDWPRLEQGVVYFLRRANRLPDNTEVERVEFRFGSLDHVRAQDGAGNQHEGYFRDQLVARVYLRGDQKPVDVIVQCLNGTFFLPEDYNKLQPIGSYNVAERFTIGPREGLIHHVDFPVAIDLAERFHLPLYRGRHMKDKAQISPAEARRLEPMTDRVQVTVQVYEGDAFDLVSMTYTPATRRR